MSRFAALLPEAALAAALALIVAVTLSGTPRRGTWARRLLAGGLAAALLGAALTLARATADDFLFAAWRVDGFSQAGKALVAALGLIALLAGRGDDGQWAAARADGPLFAGCTSLALLIALSAADLLVLLVALEIAGAAFLAHVASGGRRGGTESPARRVMVPRLAATLLMLGGIVILAGLSGSTRFDDVRALLMAGDVPGVWVAGVAMAGSGLFAALGVPPFHTGWLALETGAAPGTAGLGATAFWAAAAMIVIRLAAQLGPHDPALGAAATVLGGVAAGVGLWRALHAPDISRLLADLGIVQAGVLLIALAPQTAAAWAGAMLVAVTAPLAYATATLALARVAQGSQRLAVTELRGRMAAAPVASLALLLALATLAGLPPAAGFTARWAAVGAAWRDGWYAGAAIIVAAALAAALALGPALHALLSRAARARPPVGRGAAVALALLGLLLFAVGTAPAPVFNWAGRLVAYLR